MTYTKRFADRHKSSSRTKTKTTKNVNTAQYLRCARFLMVLFCCSRENCRLQNKRKNHLVENVKHNIQKREKKQRSLNGMDTWIRYKKVQPLRVCVKSIRSIYGSDLLTNQFNNRHCLMLILPLHFVRCIHWIAFG